MAVQALRVRSSLYIESLFRCHSIYGSHCWAPFLFEIMTIITGLLSAFFIYKGKVLILFIPLFMTLNAFIMIGIHDCCFIFFLQFLGKIKYKLLPLIKGMTCITALLFFLEGFRVFLMVKNNLRAF